MTLLDQVEILFTKFPGVQKMEKKPKFWFMRVGLKLRAEEEEEDGVGYSGHDCKQRMSTCSEKAPCTRRDTSIED
jgi:hypothetical protein